MNIPKVTAWEKHVIMRVYTQAVFHIRTIYARFTLADPMPRLCPDAVGGESGSTHPMHARPGPCRAGTPFTLADAPVHCRPIWIRSRVHYDSLSCLFIWLASYMLCTTLTDPVFHPHTPFCFCFSLFFFKFMETSAPPADKNTCHQT